MEIRLLVFMSFDISHVQFIYFETWLNIANKIFPTRRKMTIDNFIEKKYVSYVKISVANLFLFIIFFLTL